MVYVPEVQVLRIGFPIPVSKGEIVFKYPSRKGFDFMISIEKITRFEFSTEALKKGCWEVLVNWTDGTSKYYMEGEVEI